MPSPLDFIQNIAQTLQLAKAGSPKQSANAAKADESPESHFSSALDNALQQKQAMGKQQPAKTGKPVSPEVAENEALEKETLKDHPILKATDTPTPELMAAQAQLLTASGTPMAPDSAEQSTGLPNGLLQLVNQGNQQQVPMKATNAEQMAHVPSLPAGIETTSANATLPTQPAKENHPKGSASAKTDAEQKPETIDMAQSFGLTTLSPEALGLMGMPIEFQMQQALQQAPALPTTPTKGEAQAITSKSTQISATQDTGNVQQTALPASGLAAKSPAKTTPTASFEATLLDASQDSGNVQQAILPESGLAAKAPLQATPAPQFEATMFDVTQGLNVTQGTSTAAAESPVSPTGLPVLEQAPDVLKTDTPPAPMDLTSQASGPTLVSEMLEANPQAAQLTGNNAGIKNEAHMPDPLTMVSKSNGKASGKTGTPATQQAATSATTPTFPLGQMADLQNKLSALNGAIETPDADSDALAPDALTLPDNDDDSSARTDVLSALMPGDVQGAAQVNANHQTGSPDKLPTFMSPAPNPADQVVDGAIYSAQNGNRELILKLNPDNLGEVRINLISHGNNEMSARLIASNPESHALLKTQADSLKASLQAQGIHIEHLSVVLAGHAESSGNTSQQDQPKQFQQPQSQTMSQNQSQQQSFQQQAQNPNLFFQGGGQFQHKQGFAQNPGNHRYGQFAGGGTVEGPTITETASRRNDNGNLNLLA